MTADARLHYPATARNRDAILEVLRAELPQAGTVLELASGSGEHALAFAAALPTLTWQPSDPEAAARASIAAWAQTAGAGNLLSPLALDAGAPETWPSGWIAAMVCINMIHISPWDATLGLFSGAGRLLPRGAPLVTYGPYRRAGLPLEPGNAAFDADLRQRDPRWGLRLVEDVAQVARDNGLALTRLVEMPANNLSLVFRRQ